MNTSATKSQLFKHIYVEKGIYEHERTKRIISHFENSEIIIINHYKDIFCRPSQNISFQKKQPSLILAKKEGRLIYDGAKVCQSFDNRYFYYTSCIMNCLFDCEYCYLKGMYPSAYITVFVNIEDIFEQIDELLKKHNAYISVSYDTDILSLEGITGFTKSWCDYVHDKEGLNIEIRTKAAPNISKDKYKVSDNVIFAYTVTPDVINNCEHKAPSTEKRLYSALSAKNSGFPVRLCLDPIIAVPNFKESYSRLLKKADEILSLSSLKDISIGTFRISSEYMKKLKKSESNSSIVQYPFDITNGVYHYPKKIEEEMLNFIKKELLKYISEDKIFAWES